MSRKNPTHPGRIVGGDCLEELGLTITSAAKVLGVSRTSLSRLINGRASVSPEMAIRLSNAFGSTPEFWLRMQHNYDLAQIIARVDEIKVERYRPKDQLQDGEAEEADTAVVAN